MVGRQTGTILYRYYLWSRKRSWSWFSTSNALVPKISRTRNWKGNDCGNSAEDVILLKVASNHSQFLSMVASFPLAFPDWLQSIFDSMKVASATNPEDVGLECYLNLLFFCTCTVATVSDNCVYGIMFNLYLFIFYPTNQKLNSTNWNDFQCNTVLD